MNVIILDYDLLNQEHAVREAFDNVTDTKIVSIKEKLLLPEDMPVRCVLLTELNGGFLAYHFELIDKYPEVQHWVICITASTGSTVQQTLRQQFASDMAPRDAYCELLFDESEDLKNLKESLAVPAKCAKKCVIVSQNAELAESVGDVICEYLPEWEVVTGTEPDYRYCDVVIAVGNQFEELCVPCPQGETIKKLFWIQMPYPKDKGWKRDQLSKLKERMNELGWNISDFSARTNFSNLSYENFLIQIQHGEIHPMAMRSEPQFVMWDDYGLPIPQSTWADAQILEFLQKNAVFPFMANKMQLRKKS